MSYDGKHAAVERVLPRGELAELLARAADGEQAAWVALVDRLGAVVWAATRAHRLRDCDADDVFQTTWLRLVEHVDRIVDPERLPGWVAKTARHESINVIRRGWRLVPCGELPDQQSDAPAAGERLFADRRDVALADALARLCPRDRALLQMLTADPTPTYEEVGHALGMPVGSIGPTRGRALARLRRELARVGLTADLVGVVLA